MTDSWLLKFKTVVPHLVLVAAVLLAYSNALSGAFQFDDYNVIVDARGVHSWDAWFSRLGHQLRPLLNASYTFNWAIDPDPFGFHLFNIFIHLVNVLLVAALVLEFGKRSTAQADWKLAAFSTALLFAVHPLHTEAVTYLSGRSTSLMNCLYLAALLSYARSNSAIPWVSLLLFLIAITTKESALLFPFALLTWDLTTGESLRKIWTRHRPFWLMSVVAGLALASVPAYRALLASSLTAGNLYGNFPTQFNAVSQLAASWLWPVSPNIDPDWPQIISLQMVVIPMLAWGGIALLAWRSRVSHPWLTFGIAWAALHLLLLNFVLPRTDVANERLLYWSDWGVLMALSIELQRFRKATLVAIAALAIPLGIMTIARNEDYRSEVALWQQTVLQSPNKARPWNNLGYALQNEGRYVQATYAYRRALEIDPTHIKTINNLNRMSGGISGSHR